jgi:hypothetical protein
MSRPKKRRIHVKKKTKEGEISFDWTFFDDPLEDLAAGFLGLAFAFARPFLQVGPGNVRGVPNFDAYFYAREQIRRQQRDPGTWRRTLGLSDPITRRQVIERFRELARRHHPDHGGDHKKFVELVAARDAALDEVRV